MYKETGISSTLGCLMLLHLEVYNSDEQCQKCPRRLAEGKLWMMIMKLSDPHWYCSLPNVILMYSTLYPGNPAAFVIYWCNICLIIFRACSFLACWTCTCFKLFQSASTWSLLLQLAATPSQNCSKYIIPASAALAYLDLLQPTINTSTCWRLIQNAE